MKKIVAIVLSLVLAFSASLIAFATDYLTCPVCNKKYPADDDGLAAYNACIDKHAKEDNGDSDGDTAEDDDLYKCPVCGKTYDNIYQYNDCIDSHDNELEFNWDFYIKKTLPDLMDDYISIFNDTGIMDFVRDLIERAISIIESFFQTADTEPVTEVTE